MQPLFLGALTQPRRTGIPVHVRPPGASCKVLTPPASLLCSSQSGVPGIPGKEPQATPPHHSHHIGEFFSMAVGEKLVFARAQGPSAARSTEIWASLSVRMRPWTVSLPPAQQ